ncbi:iron ABC transporter permease [Desulfovibrionales bacterium]
MVRPDRRVFPVPCGCGASVRVLFLLALGLGIFILSCVGMKFGAISRTWADIYEALFSSAGDENLRYFIVSLRLPKVAAALAVGAALAVSGVILQNVLNNPLASSFTLGLSQGAAFGASFSMIVLSSTAGMIGVSIVALGAFVGALSAASLILVFSLVRGMTPQGLILAGVALSTLFGAATMSLQYFASDHQIAATVYWTFGDLSKGSWREAILVGCVMIMGLGYALRRSLDYDALRWGDAQAQALGVSVVQLRWASLLAASLMSATATAFYGVIGFVGLVSPHMIRLIFPHCGHFFLLAAAALFGAFFLLAADLIAQSLLYPTLLPIGIICAFTGVPMFLFLLFRGAARNA